MVDPNVIVEGMKNGMGKNLKKVVMTAVIIIVLAILLFGSIVIVPAGGTGVVVTLGKVSTNVMQEGFHLKMPIVQKVEIISNKIQKEEVDAAAVSKDLQSVNSTIAVNFRVGLDSSAKIYKNIGRDVALHAKRKTFAC